MAVTHKASLSSQMDTVHQYWCLSKAGRNKKYCNICVYDWVVLNEGMTSQSQLSELSPKLEPWNAAVRAGGCMYNSEALIQIWYPHSLEIFAGMSCLFLSLSFISPLPPSLSISHCVYSLGEDGISDISLSNSNQLSSHLTGKSQHPLSCSLGRLTESRWW